MGFFDLFSSAFKPNPYKGVIRKCPNCKKKVDLGNERCPHCGVHISSMFKKKCPKCKTLNNLDAPICKKCEYNFQAEFERAKKQAYKCPLCGYEAGYYMLRCPACGARFG